MKERFPGFALALVLVAMSTCLTATIGVAQASKPSGSCLLLKTLDGADPIVIRGRVGDDSTFTRSVGVISSQDMPELLLRFSDLRRQGGTESIPREQVASSGKTTLRKDTPEDFTIKVTGITVPGSYDGTLSFLVPGQGANSALTLKLSVIADPVPKLTLRPGASPIKIQLSRISGPHQWIRELLHSRPPTQTYQLQFYNDGLGSYPVQTGVAGIGDQHHAALDGYLTTPPLVHVTGAPLFALGITMQSPTPLPPDQYDGDVLLQLPAPAATLRVPIEVQVRSGLFWPIVALVLGIFLGRVIKYMKDKGGPQSDLLLRLYNLEDRIALVPDDWTILKGALDDARSRIYQMKLDEAKPLLDSIEKRFALLGELRGLEKTLASDASTDDIRRSIGSARQIIGQGKDADALTAVKAIEAAIAVLRQSRAGGASAAQYALVSAQLKATIDAASQAASTIPPPRPSLAMRILRFLTGIDSGRFRAELTLMFIRPVLYLLLIVGLTALGLQQFYFKNPTFGADPFSDYLGVFLWAISSDVSSRTLASLKS